EYAAPASTIALPSEPNAPVRAAMAAGLATGSTPKKPSLPNLQTWYSGSTPVGAFRVVGRAQPPSPPGVSTTGAGRLGTRRGGVRTLPAPSRSAFAPGRRRRAGAAHARPGSPSGAASSTSPSRLRPSAAPAGPRTD